MDWSPRSSLVMPHVDVWLDPDPAVLARAGLEIEGTRPYLRPELVRAWHALDWLQQSPIGHRRAIGPACGASPATGWSAWPGGRPASTSRRRRPDRGNSAALH